MPIPLVLLGAADASADDPAQPPVAPAPPIAPDGNLGVGGQVTVGSMTDEDDGPRFITKGIALVFAVSHR